MAPQASINQKTAEELTSLVREGKAPAEEEVEIAVAPPVDAHSILSFCTHLKETASAEIVATIGSWDKGTVMIVGLRKPVPLLDILSHMDEVSLAWEKPEETHSHVSHIPLIGHKTEKPPPARRRIHVVLKEDVAQLTLNM